MISGQSVEDDSVVELLSQRIERRPAVIDRLGDALARLVIAIDTARGAQTATVRGAEWTHGDVEQHGLTDEGSQVEMVVLDGERVEILRALLVTLGDVHRQIAADRTEAPSARAVPGASDFPVDDDRVVQALERQHHVEQRARHEAVVDEFDVVRDELDGDVPACSGPSQDLDDGDDEGAPHDDQRS
jgi:hypothetical protein